MLGPNPAQVGTRAVKEIMEKIKRERIVEGGGARGSPGEEEMKMEAAAMKSGE